MNCPKPKPLRKFQVYSIRLLCGDMVDRASSGHLGTPFGCAPLANALWGRLRWNCPCLRYRREGFNALSYGPPEA